jgi:cell division septum initiation protein DivIVA
MDDRLAAHADVPAHVNACRCSDVDVLLDSLRSRIEELELRVTAAHDRQATAVAKLEELTTAEQQLGRTLLTAETEFASTRHHVELAAAAIVDDAEARAGEIARRGDAAAAQLLELAGAIRSGTLDPEHVNLPSSPDVVDLSDAPSQVAPPADRFLDALRTSVLDDPALGPIRIPRS